ncbi:MAG TPA: PH domain-containing protein, partial [Candidatus Cloacimonetes bacterium]|nr:PH domain-containing protein [Candidatus Cloacimonadota bacterium]
TMPDMAVDTTISPTNKDQVVATYRTHWLILIKKVLVPSSLLLCNLLLFLFLSSNGVDILSNNLWPVIILVIQSGLIVWWLYQFFDWRNDHYIITREQIIDLYQRPFGLRNQRTAPLENIQSIRYEKKGLLGILLNFGTVYIRIGDEEFTFDKVPDPSAVQEKIYTIFNNRIEEMNKKKLTDQQRRLAGWMETFHRIKEKKKSDESLSE